MKNNRSTSRTIGLLLLTAAGGVHTAAAADAKPDPHAQYDQALACQRGDGVAVDLEKARTLLETAADAGDLLAMDRLADMYMTASGGVSRDFAKAAKLYQRLDDAGYAWGALSLAGCYQHGMGVTRDLERYRALMQRAKKLAQAAADRGDSHAMTALASMLDVQPKTPEALAQRKEILTKAANLGNPNAMAHLAYVLTRQVHPTKEDYEKALDWAKRAAAKQDAFGLECLAAMYQREKSPYFKDAALAIDLLKKAVERGKSDATNGLYFAYAKGRGVAVDKKEAFNWLKQGAALGNTLAMVGVDTCYHTGTGVEKDPATGMTYLRKAADTGDPFARLMYALSLQSDTENPDASAEATKIMLELGEEEYPRARVHLGDMYRDGRGVQADLRAARQWYSSAVEMSEGEGLARALGRLGESYHYCSPADQDLAKAMELYLRAAEMDESNSIYGLGVMYHDGQGVIQDYVEARKWWTRAAELGHLPAMSGLGYIYEHGEGVKADITEAIKWYRKCADAGGPAGMMRLARLYETGDSVPADLAQAREWYEKAAKAGRSDAKQWLDNHPVTVLP